MNYLNTYYVVFFKFNDVEGREMFYATNADDAKHKCRLKILQDHGRFVFPKFTKIVEVLRA